MRNVPLSGSELMSLTGMVVSFAPIGDDRLGVPAVGGVCVTVGVAVAGGAVTFTEPLVPVALSSLEFKSEVTARTKVSGVEPLTALALIENVQLMIGPSGSTVDSPPGTVSVSTIVRRVVDCNPAVTVLPLTAAVQEVKLSTPGCKSMSRGEMVTVFDPFWLKEMATVTEEPA